MTPQELADERLYLALNALIRPKREGVSAFAESPENWVEVMVTGCSNSSHNGVWSMEPEAAKRMVDRSRGAAWFVTESEKTVPE